MDKVWQEMYDAAKSVLCERRISDYVTCGEVSAAVRSKSGRIYTGVCVDTCSTLGICAERNAIFNMITNGEQEIDKVLCILPDGSNGAKCIRALRYREESLPLSKSWSPGSSTSLSRFTSWAESRWILLPRKESAM